MNRPSAPTATARVRLSLHGLTAGSLFLAAALATWATDWVTYLSSLNGVFLAGGMITLLCGFLRRPAWFLTLSSRLCLVGLSTLATVALVEVTCRLLPVDFRHQQAWIQRSPPGFRRPLVPTGTVFFRHQGGVFWTGRVQFSQLQLVGFDPTAYAEETPVTLRYDEFGFRNEPRPDQWTIAVAGDSFTELGDVPYEDLFTTRLGHALNCRVLNLGVAATGPLTQLSYLLDYGLSPATRDFVIVFFEGNDLRDIALERAAEHRYAETGRRSFRPIRPQSSFLRAAGEWLTQPAAQTEPCQPRVDAQFVATDRLIPVTLDSPPLRSADLSPLTLEALASFLTRFAALGRDQNARVWLAYMPSKIRVLQPKLQYGPDATPALRQWQPTDLPEFLANRCAAHGIGFINLTPDLIEHVKSTGELVYNHLQDCHLNARGSRVVANTLAHALGNPPEPNPR